MNTTTLQTVQTAVLNPDGMIAGIRILAEEIERLRAENDRLRVEHEALIDEVMGDLCANVRTEK